MQLAMRFALPGSLVNHTVVPVGMFLYEWTDVFLLRDIFDDLSIMANLNDDPFLSSQNEDFLQTGNDAAPNEKDIFMFRGVGLSISFSAHHSRWNVNLCSSKTFICKNISILSWVVRINSPIFGFRQLGGAYMSARL